MEIDTPVENTRYTAHVDTAVDEEIAESIEDEKEDPDRGGTKKLK